MIFGNRGACFSCICLLDHYSKKIEREPIVSILLICFSFAVSRLQPSSCMESEKGWAQRTCEQVRSSEANENMHMAALHLRNHIASASPPAWPPPSTVSRIHLPMSPFPRHNKLTFAATLIPPTSEGTLPTESTAVCAAPLQPLRPQPNNAEATLQTNAAECGCPNTQ